MHILTFNDSLAKPQVKLSMHSYLYPTEIINVITYPCHNLWSHKGPVVDCGKYALTETIISLYIMITLFKRTIFRRLLSIYLYHHPGPQSGPVKLGLWNPSMGIRWDRCTTHNRHSLHDSHGNTFYRSLFSIGNAIYIHMFWMLLLYLVLMLINVIGHVTLAAVKIIPTHLADSSMGSNW